MLCLALLLIENSIRARYLGYAPVGYLVLVFDCSNAIEFQTSECIQALEIPRKHLLLLFCGFSTLSPPPLPLLLIIDLLTAFL